MGLSKTLLPEFDHEMANTRKVLERVPDENLGWKPHQKSWSVQELSTHLANLPTWVLHTINGESIDIAPTSGQVPKVTPASSQRELLDRFDENVAKARAAIAAANDEQLLQAWTLFSGGKSVLTMPRIAVLRGLVMNHSIHHRAQLGVYLRMNDIPVPAIYGPSADEGEM